MVYVTRCTGLGPFAPGLGVTGRPGPVPPVAVVPARPVPSVVPAAPRPSARHPGAGAAPQAPLIARRPRVASMRWLLPDLSSS